MISEVLHDKYESSAKRIKALWKEANEKNLSDNITKYELEKFVKHMQDKLAPGTAKQYAARLKAAMNACNDVVTFPKDYEKILTPKAPKNVSTYLTTDEIERFAAYTPKDANERAIWALFLLECYTGARTSDCELFTSSTIVDGKIDYISQKTKIHAVIPCKPIVREIIEHDWHKVASVTEATKNAIIRRICEAVGINSTIKVYQAGKEQVGAKYDFITSHSGRRSFATNLYLRCRDLYAISRLMGHTNIEQTTKYICVEIIELPDTALEFFK